MNPDERLLAPCTADLLRGWTGPVHGYVHRGQPTRAVCVGEFDAQGRVYLWTQMGDWLMRPEDLSLDLSLAECRDRVARVLAAPVTTQWGATSPPWECRLEGEQSWVLGLGVVYTWAVEEPGEIEVPALADLDPSDDTRLSDGSLLVDALALAAVWREVSRGK